MPKIQLVFYETVSIAGASLQTSSFQDALITKNNPNILLQSFIHKNIHMYFNQCVNELLIVIKNTDAVLHFLGFYSR